MKTNSKGKSTRKTASVAKTQAKHNVAQPSVTPETQVDFLGLLNSFRSDLLYQMDLKLATLMSQHQANVPPRKVVFQKGTNSGVPSHSPLNLQQGNNYLQWPPLAV